MRPLSLNVGPRGNLVYLLVAKKVVVLKQYFFFPNVPLLKGQFLLI